MEEKLVIVKSAGGLSNLVSGNGESISPKQYTQDTKDRERDGRFIGDYKNLPFPKSQKYFAPLWDANKNEYPWSADAATFKKLVKDLMLKYPENHPKAGSFIEADDLGRHQKDYEDPIFTHNDLMSKYHTTGGVGTLNTKLAKEAFIYYCSVGRKDVIDDAKENLNPLIAKSASVVFSSPEKVNVRKRKGTDLLLEAMGAINDAKNDVNKLRSYAILSNIPGIGIHSDTNELVNTLTAHISDFGDRNQSGTGYATLNEAMVAYSKMGETELRLRYILKLARDRGVIKIGSDGFFLKDKLISGYTNLQDIYMYLNSEDTKAVEVLTTLLDRMKELNHIT